MKLGEWLPDQPAYGHDGLVTARNVFASALGYEPAGSYSAVTIALPSGWTGGRSFKGVDGTTALLSGSTTDLYYYDGAAWTSVFSGVFSSPWQFGQFGNLAIGVQGDAPVKYDITSGVATLLGGTPPNGTMITTVKDFVVISGVDSANSTVYWSAINNAEGWTIGTDQSDVQILPDGGAVTGLAGGEYLLVFQESQIWRGQYVGTPFIFQFDKISQGLGCIASRSIVEVGRTVYFISQRGFMSITDGAVQMIGANKVDRSFFAQYSEAAIREQVTASVDPVRKIVCWAMPRRLWVYNWELDRWTDYEDAIFAVSGGAERNFTLDDIAALYPGGIDTVPGSFDDPIWEGGQPFLMMAADDGTLGTFGPLNAQANIKTAEMEMVKGRDIRVRSMRVDSDVLSGLVLNVNAKKRLGDTPVQYTGNSIRNNGDMPIRASGRYAQTELVFAAETEWTFVNAFEFVQAAAGTRQ